MADIRIIILLHIYHSHFLVFNDFLDNLFMGWKTFLHFFVYLEKVFDLFTKYLPFCEEYFQYFGNL